MSDSAGSVKVVLQVDAASYSAALDKANSKIKQFGAAAEAAGHSSVTSSQAASAAIRTLEGGINGSVRAAEKFLSTIPGVGKALVAAFPVFGALAVVDVFAKLGMEAIATIKKIENMQSVIREGFLSLNESGLKSVDGMRVVNDKLEQQIALLQHKPVNTLALTLDEAREKADDLAISLNRDYTSLKKLLDENGNGIFAQLLGKASTTDVKNGIVDRQANIRTLGLQQQDQLHNGDTSGAEDTKAKIKAAQDAALQWVNSQLNTRQGKAQTPNGDMIDYAKIYGDQGVNLEALRGFRGVLQTQEDTQTEGDRNSADVVTQKKLEAGKAGLEAQKKLEDALFALDEAAEKKQNAFNKLTINEEIKFWSDRIDAFTKGGAAYLKVQDKIYGLISSRPDLTAENKKNRAEAGEFTVEGNKLLGEGAQAFQAESDAAAERATKSAEQYAAAVSKGAEMQHKNATALAESSVSIEVQQGRISQLAAAQQEAAIHAHEHAQALKDINDALAKQISLIDQMPQDKMSDADKLNAIRNANAEADNQRGEVNGQYATTQQSDNANILASTVGGKWSTAVDQMLQEWSDMTSKLTSTFRNTVDGLNDDLVKVLTRRPGTQTHLGADVRNTLSAGVGGIAKAGLEKIEGSVFGGLRKADGSASSPFHVIMAGVSAVASAAGSVTSAASGGGGILGGIGGFLKSIGVPFLAGGGDAMEGHPHVIGERGPELFVPSVSGKVIPNGKYGGSTTHQYSIDARAAHDPVAVEAAVNRALVRHAPSIVKASVSATKEQQRRSPLSKR